MCDYMMQKQTMHFTEHRKFEWRNDGDVIEVTFEQVLDLHKLGSTVCDDPKDRDVTIVVGPSRRVRHLIIASSHRKALELYYALNGR